MGIRILPLASKKERKARLQMLAALRQQGMGVGGLAQTFWTLAVGLELCNSELSKIFNDCLDNPLPLWEMEGLRSLDFWEFIDYLCYRNLAMSCWSESIAVPPEMPDPAPVDDEPSLPLSHKRRSRRRRAAKSALVVSSPVVLEDLTLVVSSPVVLEDLTLVVSSPVVLEDPTLVISSPVVREDLTLVVSVVTTEPPNFTAAAAIVKKAVFAFGLWTFLRGWEHSEFTPEPAPVREPSESTPEPAPVREPSGSTPEPAPVQEPSESTPELAPVQEPSESIPELIPVQESSEPTQVYEFPPELVPVQESTPEPAPVPSEVAASAAEPPEAAVSASAPLWAVAPTPELSVCPVTDKETVAERSACPFVAIRAVTNLSLLLFAVLPEPLGSSSALSALLRSSALPLMPAKFLAPPWLSAGVPVMSEPHWFVPPALPWPPALPAPPWHPCLPQSPGPLPLHGPGPPSLPLIRLLSTSLLNFFVFSGGVSGIRSLKGR